MTRPWMQTLSCKRWDVLNPAPEKVDWTDIAVSLSRTARFRGHTARFYSVAEHSVHVMRVVRGLTDDPVAHLAALLHDAHEAYLGDMITPVASALGVKLPEFRTVWGWMKLNHDTAIFTAAGIEPAQTDPTIKKLVKDADAAVLLDERDQLFAAPPPDDWGVLEGMSSAGCKVGVCDTMHEARVLFSINLDCLLKAVNGRSAA